MWYAKLGNFNATINLEKQAVKELEKHSHEFGEEKIDADHYFIDMRLYNLNTKIF